MVLLKSNTSVAKVKAFTKVLQLLGHRINKCPVTALGLTVTATLPYGDCQQDVCLVITDHVVGFSR